MNKAKALMDTYDAFRRDALNEENYDLAQAFSQAENLVNNVMHGLPFDKVAPKVEQAINEIMNFDFTTDGELEGFQMALEILREFETS